MLVGIVNVHADVTYLLKDRENQLLIVLLHHKSRLPAKCQNIN